MTIRTWPVGEETWRPSHGQELLLQSALLAGESGLVAWRRWKDSADIDRLDWNSQRLLPLVQANLQRIEPADPLMPRLKSIRKKTWYKNHMLFALAEPVLDAFREAGVRTILLKGATLILTSYRDYSLRPLEDIDILVPPGAIDTARGILAGFNWRPRYPLRHPVDFYWMWANHALGYSDDRGGQIDLHWDTKKIHGPGGADETLWRHACLTRGGGREHLVLSPEDQLLHILDHGTSDRPTPILWIPDALCLLRASKTEMDWGRFLDRAVEQRMILRSRKMLMYLKDHFQTDIPLDFLQSIMKEPVSSLERRLYRKIGCRGTKEFFWNRRLFRPVFLLSFDPESRKSPITFAVLYWKLWRATHNFRFIWEIPLKATGLTIRVLKRMLAVPNMRWRGQKRCL